MTVKRELLPDGSYMFTGMGEVTGKGGKRRTFLVGMNAVQAVAAYLTEQRTADQNPALFLSSRKQRLSDRAIQEILGKWCKRLHVPHVHIHQLRHSYATRNVNAGMSAAVLQTLLGHASLMTTQRYFHIQSERVAREYFSVMEFVRIGSAV
jgi:integrase/recombinase XerC